HLYYHRRRESSRQQQELYQAYDNDYHLRLYYYNVHGLRGRKTERALACTYPLINLCPSPLFPPSFLLFYFLTFSRLPLYSVSPISLCIPYFLLFSPSLNKLLI